MREHAPFTVLQFGETGQVARELLCRLPGKDFRLKVVGRQDVDFAEPQRVAEIVRETDCDAVINAVAYTAVDKAQSDADMAMTVNALAVGAMAWACAARAVPLIHISTDYVFDGEAAAPYREVDTTNPINVYGATKLAGENAIRDVLPQHVILRTSWVYSAHGANFVKTMLRLGMERDELRVVDDQIGSPTAASHIACAIQAILLQLQTDLSPGLFGTFHYTGAGQASWFAFAKAIFAEAGNFRPIKAQLRAIPSSEYPTPAARPRNSLLDCGKIESVYDIRPLPWENGMREAIARLVENGDMP